jgi:DNA-binding NarL/FixJ family response regulator
MTTTERAGPQRIRVLIVDDQQLVRRGLALMLSLDPDMEVLGGPATASRRSRWPPAAA